MNPFEKFYDYQNEAKVACKGQPKGIVCLPTGTGKTFLEAGIIAETIVEEPWFQTYVINAPRILLSFQLCMETYQFLLQCGIEARYMFVHTGGTLDERETEEIRIVANEATDAKVPYSTFLHGTDTDSIVEAMKGAKTLNIPLILIATYNSCERAESARKRLDLPPIRLVVNDEAHYLVQERFFDILHTLTYRQCLFFTATTKETPSPDGRGMNNVDAYGPILYNLSPRDAMDKGRIVRPRLHFVTTKVKLKAGDEVDAYTNYLIKEAFKQHESHLAFTARDRDTGIQGITTEPLNPKMLVALRGVGEIIGFLDSEEYQQMREQEIEIFAISSNDTVGNNINKGRTNRPDFLKTLKAMGNDPTKKVLALHFDILTEGIDVNGFTGLLALRYLTKTKFIQGYGRTARLHPIDRKNIEDKVILPWEWKKQMKPFSYVLLPDIATQTNDQKQSLIDLIWMMREYGYDFAEHILGDQMIRAADEENPMKSLLEKEKEEQLALKLEELFAELEASEAAALAETDPKGEFTWNRAQALGMGRRATVQTPQGPGIITGFSGENIKVRIDNGQPFLFTFPDIRKN